MTIYVLFASGKYTDDINGEPMTADRTELIVGFKDYNKALELLRSGNVDVAEPSKWGVRGICVESVEVKD